MPHVSMYRLNSTPKNSVQSFEKQREHFPCELLVRTHYFNTKETMLRKYIRIIERKCTEHKSQKSRICTFKTGRIKIILHTLISILHEQ